MTFSIIVAADRNNGIGCRGKLPWPRLKHDLEHFKALTMGGAVIMGRRTWDSLPASVRPLPGRLNVVLTRFGRGWPALDDRTGAFYGSSLDESLAFTDKSRMSPFVIGGGQLYKLTLAHQDCSTVYLTRIDAEYECDTWLPPLEGWKRREIVATHAEPVPYQIERWERA